MGVLSDEIFFPEIQRSVCVYCWLKTHKQNAQSKLDWNRFRWPSSPICSVPCPHHPSHQKLGYSWYQKSIFCGQTDGHCFRVFKSENYRENWTQISFLKKIYRHCKWWNMDFLFGNQAAEDFFHYFSVYTPEAYVTTLFTVKRVFFRFFSFCLFFCTIIRSLIVLLPWNCITAIMKAIKT